MIKKVFTAVMMSLLLIMNSALPAFAETASGSSLRLEKTEGTVTLTNKNGKEISVSNGMVLYSGYKIKTALSSYAYISLDGTKAVKLDAVSSAEIKKNGNKLEMLLESGNLFFDVSSPVSDDASLNIRTSTMVTGIRGTMGAVSVIDPFESILYMLEGSTSVTVIDPKTRQYSTHTVLEGQIASSMLIEAKEGQSQQIDFEITKLKEKEVPPFAALEIARDEGLRSRLNPDVINLDELLKDAEARAKQEQAALAERQKAIQEQLKKEQNVIVGGTENIIPVFGETETAAPSGGSSPELKGILYGGTVYTTWDDGTLTVEPGVEFVAAGGIEVAPSYDSSTIYIQNNGKIIFQEELISMPESILTLTGNGIYEPDESMLAPMIVVQDATNFTIAGGTYLDANNGETIIRIQSTDYPSLMNMTGGYIYSTEDRLASGGAGGSGVYISEANTTFVFSGGTIFASGDNGCGILQNVSGGASYTNPGGGILSPSGTAQGLITE